MTTPWNVLSYQPFSDWNTSVCELRSCPEKPLEMGAGHGPDPPGGRHWGRTWLGVQPQDLRCLSRWRRCDGPRGRARQAATGTGGPVGSLRSLESGCVPPSARAPGRDCGQAAALGTGSVSVVPVSQKPLWKGLFSIKKSNRQGSEPGPITCCRGPSLRRRNSLAASLHRAARRRPFSGHLSLPSEEHCPPRDPPPQPSAARRQQQTSEEDKRPAGPVWHVPPVPSRGAVLPWRTWRLRPRPDLSTPFKKPHDEDKYLAISAPSTTT